jgi:hypothetical protein
LQAVASQATQKAPSQQASQVTGAWLGLACLLTSLAVITDYIEVFKPLKAATKRLEGRGKGGRFGAIYEVIPVFEFLMAEIEQRLRQYEKVDYKQRNAPKDHLAINLRAAWEKIRNYYAKLDDSPAYFTACCLHPYYKRYCEKSWVDKPDWLAANLHVFCGLWSDYVAVNICSCQRVNAQGSESKV